MGIHRTCRFACLGTILVALTYLPIAFAEEADVVPQKTFQPASKQKEEFSGGACVIQTGAFPVGFNAYVIPEGDHPSYPPFCSPVPAGPLNLVMDLLAQDVREVPLTVKLMKVEGAEEREILSLPPTKYTSGNIALTVKLEPNAKYKVLLIGAYSSESVGNLVEIPLDVRREGDFVHTGTGGTGWGFLLLVLGLAALTGGAIHLWRPTPPKGPGS